jgi:hypothetical protein
MKYFVMIIIIIVSAYCGNYIYNKTNVCDFIINKLKINTKIKCTFIDIIAIFFGMVVISNILINYKDILSDIGLFIAVFIGGLSDYIRRELKSNNKKQ